jgi:hypothetical protein
MVFVGCRPKFRFNKIATCVPENRQIKGTGIFTFAETSINGSSVGSISTRLTMTLILTIVGIGGIAIVSTFHDLARYLVNFITLVYKSAGTSYIQTLTLGVASTTGHDTITPFE